MAPTLRREGEPPPLYSECFELRIHGNGDCSRFCDGRSWSWLNKVAIFWLARVLDFVSDELGLRQ